MFTRMFIYGERSRRNNRSIRDIDAQGMSMLILCEKNFPLSLSLFTFIVVFSHSLRKSRFSREDFVP